MGLTQRGAASGVPGYALTLVCPAAVMLRVLLHTSSCTSGSSTLGRKPLRNTTCRSFALEMSAQRRALIGYGKRGGFPLTAALCRGTIVLVGCCGVAGAYEQYENALVEERVRGGDRHGAHRMWCARWGSGDGRWRLSTAELDLLYQADWSGGLNGWAGGDGWKTLNGLLLNDGTGYCCSFNEYPAGDSQF